MTLYNLFDKGLTNKIILNRAMIFTAFIGDYWNLIVVLQPRQFFWEIYI